MFIPLAFLSCPKCKNKSLVTHEKNDIFDPKTWVMCSNCQYSQYIILSIMDYYKSHLPKIEYELSKAKVSDDDTHSIMTIVNNASLEVVDELRFLHQLGLRMGQGADSQKSVFLAILANSVPITNSLDKPPPVIPASDAVFNEINSHTSFRSSRRDPDATRMPFILPLFREYNHLVGYYELYNYNGTYAPRRKLHEWFDGDDSYLAYSSSNLNDSELILVDHLLSYFKLCYWLTCSNTSLEGLRPTFNHKVNVVYVPNGESSLRMLMSYPCKVKRITNMCRMEMLEALLPVRGRLLQFDSFREIDVSRWAITSSPIFCATSKLMLCTIIDTYFKETSIA